MYALVSEDLSMRTMNKEHGEHGGSESPFVLSEKSCARNIAMRSMKETLTQEKSCLLYNVNMKIVCVQ